MAAGVQARGAQLPNNGLPDSFARASSISHEGATRPWTIRDLVEVGEIRSIAVSAKVKQVAFVLRQPRIDSGDIRYGLYVIDIGGSGPARKLLEASYISDISRDPDEHNWTVLANRGLGVQIYDIGDAGVVRPLVISSETAVVGSSQGVIAEIGEPRSTGIISYEWAPDGSALWYSRLRLRSPTERKAFVDRGIRYDDRAMNGTLFQNYPGLFVGVELHVWKQSPESDHTVAFAPSVASSDISLMRRDWASAYWEPDSHRIRYATATLSAEGSFVDSQWVVDVRSGAIQSVDSKIQFEFSAPTPNGKGYLSVDRTSTGAFKLTEYALDGKVSRDRGIVGFSRMGKSDDLGAWRNEAGDREILGVAYPDHNGLISIPDSAAAKTWTSVGDNIDLCSFAKDLSFGACVRQSLTLAPELVLVDPNDGRISTLVRPNSGYGDIKSLRTEHAIWKNRYGNGNDGYITYPPGYDARHKYPVVVVTHAVGAENRFVEKGFQAEIPLQVLAEDGYIVLSVNEPRASFRVRATLQETTKSENAPDIARKQFSMVLDPVAAMEAALEDLIEKGVADPEKTGIAGYSRGAEVAAYVMTQSTLFKAASLGDGASAINADGYWSWGTRLAPIWYGAIYGGSPYDADPKILDNYRKLSPAFRAKAFAGPVLEQPTEINAPAALERMTLLREAGIPFELVFYPNESHVFWNPRHIAAAMQRTEDWFNFWLLGTRDHDSSKDEQYRRWQALKSNYRAVRPVNN